MSGPGFSGKMLDIQNMPRHQAFSHLLQLLNGLILLVSIAMLIYSAIYVRKPGPTTYYSHFSSLYLSACLAFQSLQVFRRMSRRNPLVNKWHDFFANGYLVILTLCGLINGIAFSCTPKPDTVAISFLSFFDGIVALIDNFRIKTIQSVHTSASLLPENGNGIVKSKSPFRRCGYAALRISNRVLMSLHVVLIVLSVAGAIELALTYRYINPGTRVQITLASGKSHMVNYNCTSVESSNSSLPTIWFEADLSHGVVDFIGLQTILALDHGRNSCSYDPPNMGWSDRLPADLVDYFDYFNPLLDAIGRKNEEMVLAGWGGGAKYALMHAIENRNTTTSLVLLDASPDGIEWLTAKYLNNWTETQMLNYRSTDLSGRIFLVETILGLGIPWGLMPVFIPSNSTGYFDQSLYPRYRAQGMKEDLWAYQYYALLYEAASPIDHYLVNTTAPQGMKVVAAMTYNASTTTIENASDEFSRQTKVAMANHIAGGNLSLPVIWCTDADCSLSFPVNKPVWTADALISFGV